MSIENELKILPRDNIHIQDVLYLLQDNGYSIQKIPKVTEQQDKYYDDENRTLEKKGCSFRIRMKESGAVVTYKQPVEAETEYKQREELEVTIPEEYIQKNGDILLEDALRILKEKYPDVKLPQNLNMVVQVNNNRNKFNVKAKDGTIIEVALDELSINSNSGSEFNMKNEIECEVLSGNPENLNEIYELLKANYSIEKNDLSKYARAVKEMNEQRDNMTKEEITICAMLSNIIRSEEFKQLEFKGQMIHNFSKRVPDDLKLTNFEDVEYLISKISDVKRIKNYEPAEINTLEDMFLCFFSDMDYQDIEYRLVKFLNEKYYSREAPITNRLLHSEQVMLITGLISKSKEIKESDRNTLLCMASALFHDIGHVPGAHVTEKQMADFDGFFSHEINGSNVIENIVTQNEDDIIKSVIDHGRTLEKEYNEELVKNYIERIKEQIKQSIRAHSRTNSEKRGDGTVVQLPREADKICYLASDIRDSVVRSIELDSKIKPEFFSEEWKEEMKEKYGKGYSAKESIIAQKIAEIEKFVRTGNFGELTTYIADTVEEDTRDQKVYYDVDDEIWAIVENAIKYVANLRKEGIVSKKSKEIEKVAALYLVKIFNEQYEICNKNSELAWERVVDIVTKSNDTTMLYEVNQILEEYKNNPEGLKQAYQEGGKLDTSVIVNLDKSNRQIKIIPNDQFDFIDIIMSLSLLEEQGTRERKKFRDTYYPSQGNGQDELSICVREDLKTHKKSLIAKKKRNKDGVTQMERNRYATDEIIGIDLEGLVDKLNEKYPFLKVQKTKENPLCIIETQRDSIEGKNGISARSDLSRVQAPDGTWKNMELSFEIDCNREQIKDVRKTLAKDLKDKYGINLSDYSTKKTKEELAMEILEEKDEMQKLKEE